MLTQSDGSSDGSKLAYLQQPEPYRHFDPKLFDILARAAAEPDRRRLTSIEASEVVPRAAYFNDMLSDELSARRDFMGRCLHDLASVDLVFFDPDNGMETTLAKGRKNSSKYVYLDELAAFHRTKKALLIYQHFPRIERRTFIASCVDRLRGFASDSPLWSFTTAHVVFFLVIHAESPARLAVAAMEACGHLDAGFVRGEYLGRGQ